jgi:hypothetical protein
LAEAEPGLVDRIHQIRVFDDRDLTAGRLAPNDRGRQLELTQIHHRLQRRTAWGL